LISPEFWEILAHLWQFFQTTRGSTHYVVPVSRRPSSLQEFLPLFLIPWLERLKSLWCAWIRRHGRMISSILQRSCRERQSCTPMTLSRY
jgi:hypothetical protein